MPKNAAAPISSEQCNIHEMLSLPCRSVVAFQGQVCASSCCHENLTFTTSEREHTKLSREFSVKGGRREEKQTLLTKPPRMELPPEEDIFQKQNWKRGDEGNTRQSLMNSCLSPALQSNALKRTKQRAVAVPSLVPSPRNWDNSHDFLSGGSGDPLRFVGISLWAGELGR